MSNIEVEVRSFITEEEYKEFIDFFNENGNLVNEDYQETFWFDCDQDLRIQRNKKYSKIWMKKGEMHDDHREEVEIKFERDDFEDLEKILLSMGTNVTIKWFRDRHKFNWNGVTVCVDHSKGFGHILELEKIASEEDKEEVLEELKDRMSELGIEISPKEEFEKRLNYYKENWKKLID